MASWGKSWKVTSWSSQVCERIAYLGTSVSRNSTRVRVSVLMSRMASSIQNWKGIGISRVFFFHVQVSDVYIDAIAWCILYLNKTD